MYFKIDTKRDEKRCLVLSNVFLFALRTAAGGDFLYDWLLQTRFYTPLDDTLPNRDYGRFIGIVHGKKGSVGFTNSNTSYFKNFMPPKTSIL
ncbi:hypothetical protein BIY29_03250 [Brenneria alni]|uniref:Uncharacterized protein n=1 Tax=Brenneria alni TaxID=71656 RepID=A0A421DSF0_9GAMM|nr:hypothetical protein BIY29_03250 [Brenneria alni]